MQKAYRFRAYPSGKQREALDEQMSISRRLYNLLLEKSQQHSRDYGKAFTKYDMNKRLPQGTFRCRKCGMDSDRGINAARNMLAKADTAGQAGSGASGDLAATMERRRSVASRAVESGTMLGGAS